MNHRRELLTDRLMTPIAHFSHAMRVGGFVHVGATAGTDASRRLAGDTPGRGDMQAQARRMFANLLEVLELMGSSSEGLVRVKSYVADPRDQTLYQRVFEDVLGNGRVHVLVGSHGFPLPQATVELDALALVGTARPVRLAAAEGACCAADQLHVVVQARPIRGHDDLSSQAPDALARLARVLEEAEFRREELVSLHLTVADAREALGCCARLRAWLGPIPGPACTVVVAPLPDPSLRLQIEAVAQRGGGEPLGERERFGVPGPQAVLAGDSCFIAGVLPAGDTLAADGVLAQTRACWGEIKRLLAGVGMGPEHVVRTSNILGDWRHYQSFNAGYGESVSAPYPPRTTMHGGLIAVAADVQIEAFAHRAAASATVLQTTGFSLP